MLVFDVFLLFVILKGLYRSKYALLLSGKDKKKEKLIREKKERFTASERLLWKMIVLHPTNLHMSLGSWGQGFVVGCFYRQVKKVSFSKGPSILSVGKFTSVGVDESLSLNFES